MKNFLYSYLLVWLVYVNAGSIQPTFNATDSSSNDNQIVADDKFDIGSEDMWSNTTSPGFGEASAGSPLASRGLRKEIASGWGTRDIFSRGRRWGRRRHDMSPRSFPRGRRFGYRERHPSKFGRFSPFARYEQDEYMRDYGTYPPTFDQSPLYNRQPFAFPNYQQPEFPPRSQFPYPGTQSPYLQPQTSVAAPQSYYRDPYNMMQSQQPHQFAAPPSYFPGQQANVRPQSVPSPHNANRPAVQWEDQEQPIRSQYQRAEQFPQPRTSTQPADQLVAARYQKTATSTPQENRYQPTSMELPRSGFLDQFGTSQQPGGQCDGARSQTMAAPAIQRNSAQPAGSELPSAGSFDQFRSSTPSANQRGESRPQVMKTLTPQESRYQPAGAELPRTEALDEFRTPTQPVGQRDGDRSPEPKENRENGHQGIESERKLRESNEQLGTPGQSADQRAGIQSPAETASAPQENREQLDVQRPLTGLMSFFRSPSATTTEQNNLQARSVVDSAPQQTREEPKLAENAPQAAVAA